MPDELEAQVKAGTDPLSLLAKQINQEVADGKLSPEDIHHFQDAMYPHVDAAEARWAELNKSSIPELAGEYADKMVGPLLDIQATHEAKGDYDRMTPMEAAPLVRAEGELMIDGFDAFGHAVVDIQQEKLDMWRDIVEVQASRGVETPEVVEAQRAEIDTLQQRLDDSRDSLEHKYIEPAREQLDQTVEYLESSNDPAVIHQFAPMSETSHPHGADADPAGDVPVET